MTHTPALPTHPNQVDVIIPAHNAAATLGDTLTSLLNQTYPNWSAVIVDDASSDNTAAVAQSYLDRDQRFTLISVQEGSASGARNAGLATAAGDWILFLDSDDFIDPDMLETMVKAATARSDIDAVHCGWRCVNESDEVIFTGRCGAEGDLFPIVSRSPAFAIHTCLVRRSVVDRAGLFDPSLKTVEDTDFWQRVARLGTRFVAVPDVLVTYRLRENQSWFAASRFLADAITVIRRGHDTDARISAPAAKHAAGAPRENFADAVYHAGLYACAMAIAAGGTTASLLESVSVAVEAAGVPESAALNPQTCIDTLISAIPLCLRLPQTEWPVLWERFGKAIDTLIGELAARSRDPDLYAAVMAGLQLRAASFLTDGCLEHVLVRTIAVDEPLKDIESERASTLLAHVSYGSKPLGSVTLPIFDGRVSASVLAETVAAEFAWELLGRYFAAHVYPGLQLVRGGGTGRIARGDLELGTVDESVGIDSRDFHDAVGWTLLLQEVWGLRNQPSDFFYDGAVVARLDPAPARFAKVDLGRPPHDLHGLGDGVTVCLTVAGLPAGELSLKASNGTLASAQIIRAVTLDAGFDLCRIAVREALLGRSLADPSSLADRLQTKAATRPRQAFTSVTQPLHTDSWEVLAGEIGHGKPTLAVGRWASHQVPAVSPQRAALPVSVRALITDAKGAIPVTFTTGPGAPERVDRLLYTPEIGLRVVPRSGTSRTAAAVSPGTTSVRHHFEALFAKGENPWDYTTAYEQTKYEQTLSVIPNRSGLRALELACAEGHFTVQLAPKVSTLTAADISQTALDRAHARCAHLANIRYQQLDLANDAIEGTYDVITCCEVLYYLPDRGTLESLIRKITKALARDGVVVLAHANLVVDDPQSTGFEWPAPFGAKGIGEAFAACPGLVFEHELRTRLYRIQVFSKRPLFSLARRSPTPRRVTEADYTDPEPDVKRQILWNGGIVRHRKAAPAVTAQLPILMYHSVTDQRDPWAARFCVSPSDFERQLSYLRDAGFHSATIEEWRRARRDKQPLDGHRVLLTFDDGYRDFAEHAWPLLKQFGFSATVFIPTDHVGGTAAWDARYGSARALLNWDEIKQLHADGVDFGSHSASHRSLTALDHEAVAWDLLKSRQELESHLGVPIPTLCYPYGRFSPTVAHLARAAGYAEAVSVRSGCSRMDDPAMALRRIEVDGRATFEEFIASLSTDH